MKVPSPPDSSPTPPVVEMRGVAVSALLEFERVVLSDVEWTVAPGDYWVLAGWHRSGKSDLLALAAGMSRPEAGQCRLFGLDLAKASEGEELAVRRRAGFVFPGGRLLHQMTVGENVALPLCYHREQSLDDAAGETTHLLDIVGLGNLADAMPSELGRNRLRRAGLARALALRPEWLLLDDVLSGLDYRETRWWLDLLDKLSRGHAWLDGRPLTLAVATDDLRPWAGRAKQFAVLKDRRFHVCGSRPSTDLADEPVLAEFLDESLRPAVPAANTPPS